jgi:hypothetical protein
LRLLEHVDEVGNRIVLARRDRFGDDSPARPRMSDFRGPNGVFHMVARGERSAVAQDTE